MDITDIFSVEQIELLVKYDLLTKVHYERYIIGLEFQHHLDEGMNYQEAAEIIGGKIYSFWGENKCVGVDTSKNIYAWYRKQVKKLDGGTKIVAEEVKYKEQK